MICGLGFKAHACGVPYSSLLCCHKKLVKRNVDMEMLKTNPPAVASVTGGELHIPPLV